MIESDVQNLLRCEASKMGARLWRNNVGVLYDANDRPVRYGLANESAQQNKIIKSSDLIGLTPVTIQPHHVGQTLGIFTAVEVKRTGWTYNPNDKHQLAQYNFLQLVNSLGGVGLFANDPGALAPVIDRRR